MAVSVNWLYPPNYDVAPPAWDYPHGHRRVKVQFIGEEVLTNETNVQKIDISELKNSEGVEVTRTMVESVQYDVSGCDSLKLSWDRNPKATICLLGGDSRGKLKLYKVDPGEAGDGTGDILLSTTGGQIINYDVTLCLKLK